MNTRHQTIAAEGGSFDAYWTAPGARPAPGVVVAQEIFGVNAFVRSVADRLAADGYLAAAPDLFWRQQPGIELDSSREADRARAISLNQQLDQGKAIADCDATAQRLRSDGACTGNVGVVGYCLGGRLAYLLATRTGIAAAVGYYGVGIDNLLDEASSIRCPVLLHIAGNDHLCPPAAQETIIATLRQRAPSAIVHVYPGAGHGFAREGGQNYVAAAAELANRRTHEFFAQHLRLLPAKS